MFICSCIFLPFSSHWVLNATNTAKGELSSKVTNTPRLTGLFGLLPLDLRLTARTPTELLIQQISFSDEQLETSKIWACNSKQYQIAKYLFADCLVFDGSLLTLDHFRAHDIHCLLFTWPGSFPSRGGRSLAICHVDTRQGSIYSTLAQVSHDCVPRVTQIHLEFMVSCLLHIGHDKPLPRMGLTPRQASRRLLDFVIQFPVHFQCVTGAMHTYRITDW